MSKIETHKGKVWPMKSQIVDQVFDNYDFTGANFNSGIFNSVTFINCLFDKTILSGSKLFYDSSFYQCVFKNTDLANSTFGNNKGLYKNCLFDKCNFRGKEFNFTRFENTVFDKCKLKSINFNASSFVECEFIGPMDDVTFNGMYDTGKGMQPVIDRCIFLKASLGDFVTFVGCDLTNSVPPANKEFGDILYNLYSDDSRVLSTGSKDRIVLTRK